MAAHHSDEQPNQRRKLDTDGDHDSCAEENKCYKPAASSVVSPVPSSVNKQVRFGNTTVILPHRYEKDRTDAEVLRQYHDDIWYTVSWSSVVWVLFCGYSVLTANDVLHIFNALWCW
jgi:hypothetical protein